MKNTGKAKKLISMLLLICLMSTLFVGCSKKETSTSEDDHNADATSKTSVENTTTEATEQETTTEVVKEVTTNSKAMKTLIEKTIGKDEDVAEDCWWQMAYNYFGDMESRMNGKDTITADLIYYDENKKSMVGLELDKAFFEDLKSRQKDKIEYPKVTESSYAPLLSAYGLYGPDANYYDCSYPAFYKTNFFTIKDFDASKSIDELKKCDFSPITFYMSYDKDVGKICDLVATWMIEDAKNSTDNKIEQKSLYISRVMMNEAKNKAIVDFMSTYTYNGKEYTDYGTMWDGGNYYDGYEFSQKCEGRMFEPFILQKNASGEWEVTY